MLHLPQHTLDRIKTLLLRRQKEVEEQLKEIDKDDPLTLDAPIESSESGTESWQAEVHGRLVSLKTDLLDLSKKITASLSNLNKGTYGKCEKCGKAIETARLEAMPTATLCLVCSKKPLKK